jgi:hypothetical protein
MVLSELRRAFQNALLHDFPALNFTIARGGMTTVSVGFLGFE